MQSKILRRKSNRVVKYLMKHSIVKRQTSKSIVTDTHEITQRNLPYITRVSKERTVYTETSSHSAIIRFIGRLFRKIMHCLFCLIAWGLTALSAQIAYIAQ